MIDLIHQRLSDEHQSGNTDIRLTSELTNTSLKACATTASLAIVEEMQARYEHSGDICLRPDSYSLRIALGAFAKACAYCNSPNLRALAKASAICNAKTKDVGRVSIRFSGEGARGVVMDGGVVLRGEERRGAAECGGLRTSYGCVCEEWE